MMQGIRNLYSAILDILQIVWEKEKTNDLTGIDLMLIINTLKR